MRPARQAAQCIRHQLFRIEPFRGGASHTDTVPDCRSKSRTAFSQARSRISAARSQSSRETLQCVSIRTQDGFAVLTRRPSGAHLAANSWDVKPVAVTSKITMLV